MANGVINGQERKFSDQAPAVGGGSSIPTVQFSVGNARVLADFSRTLFGLSSQFEDQLDQQAEAEASKAGAVAGLSGETEEQSYETLRGRAYNKAMLETFVTTMDTQTMVGVERLKQQYYDNPVALEGALNDYLGGKADELEKVAPGAGAAFRARSTARALPAVEAARDTRFKMTQDQAEASIIENEVALLGSIKQNAGGLFSKNPAQSSAASSAVMQSVNEYMRIYDAVDPTTGKPLFDEATKAKVRVNLRDKVLSEATLAWFGNNNNSVDAYLNITDPDFKMNITSFGGYKGKLPAGMRNNNPGNIKYVGQRDAVGPSKNTDQGDAQAVYATAEDGMAAMYNLLMKKYAGGKVTTMQIIAEAGGWTPAINSTAAERNRVTQIAANIARNAGIGVNDDINLGDPQSAKKFMRALMLQEHGKASNLYTDDMIMAAVTGQRKGQSAIGTDLRGQSEVGKDFSLPLAQSMSPQAYENLMQDARQRITFKNTMDDRARVAEERQIKATQEKIANEVSTRIYNAGDKDPVTGEAIKPITGVQIAELARQGLLDQDKAQAFQRALAVEKPDRSDDAVYRELQRRMYAGEDVENDILAAGDKLSKTDGNSLLNKNRELKEQDGGFSKEENFHYQQLDKLLTPDTNMAALDPSRQQRRYDALDEFRRRVKERATSGEKLDDIARDIAGRAAVDLSNLSSDAINKLVLPRFSVADTAKGGRRIDIAASKKNLKSALDTNKITLEQAQEQALLLQQWDEAQRQTDADDAKTAASKRK